MSVLSLIFCHCPLYQVSQLHEALASAEESVGLLASALEAAAKDREELSLMLTWHEARACILEERVDEFADGSSHVVDDAVIAELRQREAEMEASITQLTFSLSAAQQQAAVRSEELEVALLRRGALESKVEGLLVEIERMQAAKESTAAELSLALLHGDGLKDEIERLSAEVYREQQRALEAERQVGEAEFVRGDAVRRALEAEKLAKELAGAVEAARGEAERSAYVDQGMIGDLSDRLLHERGLLLEERETAGRRISHLEERIMELQSCLEDANGKAAQFECECNLW